MKGLTGELPNDFPWWQSSKGQSATYREVEADFVCENGNNLETILLSHQQLLFLLNISTMLFINKPLELIKK